MKRLGRIVNTFEENVIAVLLASMTLVTFSQVIARYVFNSGWDGALELTRILFAWLILFGMSYGLKIGGHLGVDAVVRLFPKPVFRVFAIIGGLACILYAAILLSADWLRPIGMNSKGGAIAYWQRFYQLGLGLDDLRYPDWMIESFGLQERVQRWIAYLILPIGLALFAFRAVQAIWQIATGRRETIVASHEAEDLVREHEGALAEEPFAETIEGSHEPRGRGPV